MRFSSWFQRVVRRLHIKQVEAFKLYRSNYYQCIKIYIPEEYEMIIKRQLNYNKKYEKINRNYVNIYRKLRNKNKNQLTLV
jgi:hypothetical protein